MPTLISLEQQCPNKPQISLYFHDYLMHRPPTHLLKPTHSTKKCFEAMEGPLGNNLYMGMQNGWNAELRSWEILSSTFVP